MPTTLIGALGNLRPVRMPPPMPVAHQRPTASIVTVGGVAKIQRAPRRTRRWSWALAWASPEAIRELIALELGVHGPGPWWWYDPLAAGLQMLPVGVASPGLGGDMLLSVAGSAALDYAANSPWSVGVAGSGEGQTPIVPAVVGRSYVAAAEVSGDARVGLRWVDAAGTVLSTSYGATGTTRRTATATAPADTAGVRVVLDPTSSVTEVRFSQLQLVEGSAPIGWEPGPGMPRVSLMGLQEVVQLASAADGWRRDLSVDLVEVG